MKPEHLETVGGITLNLKYWDCGCEHDYIHSVTTSYCKVCKAIRKNQPNSRHNEVLKHIERKEQ